MGFDVNAARKEGYSDSEIADYLASSRKFDLTGARNEGYSDEEIVGHLSDLGALPIDRTWGEVASDAGTMLTKGAVGFNQALIGVGDILTTGRFGKAVEDAGYDAEARQKQLETQYSQETQEARRKTREADGFVDTIPAGIQNPSSIITTIGESLPQMLGGAGIARGLIAGGAKIAPYLAGAIGEGVMGAGSSAEGVREESADGTLTGKQSLAAAASGAGTAAFGALGGRLAQKFGWGDIDTILAGGGTQAAIAGAAKKWFIRQVLESGISEGVFEELPQSIQEQMWQNFATSKPITEGVGNAAAMGMMAGGLTGGVGGGYNAIAGKQSTAPIDTILDAAPPSNADADIAKFNEETLDTQALTEALKLAAGAETGNTPLSPPTPPTLPETQNGTTTQAMAPMVGGGLIESGGTQSLGGVSDVDVQRGIIPEPGGVGMPGPPVATDVQGEPAPVAVGAGGEAVAAKSSFAVSDDPVKWEAKNDTWKSRAREASEKIGTVKGYDIYHERVEGGDGQVRIVTNDGRVIGDTFYGRREDGKMEGAVEVHPEYRRQGLATAMYNAIEKTIGEKLHPAGKQTQDADLFWKARLEQQPATPTPVASAQQQVFTGKVDGNNPNSGYGAAIGSLSDGNKRTLLVDEDGGYFWGDRKLAAFYKEGQDPLSGEHKNFTPAEFATSKEARDAANSTPQDRLRPNQKTTNALQKQEAKAAEAVAPSLAAPLPEIAPIPANKIDPIKRNEVVEQNRDRSTAAYLDQVRGIINDPDSLRLSFSRDAANGSPMVFDAIPEKIALGKADYAVTSFGRKLSVQYAVVEADDIVASHTVSGQENPAYSADTPAMRVIGGNGRIAGLQEAYRLGNTKNYVSGISDDAGLHGVSAEQIAGFKQPVLVRIMNNEDVTANIGDELNGRMNMELSVVEQAKTDARRLNLEALDFNEDGDLTTDAVKQFVSAMPENERAGLMDKGQPGQRATDRVMAAMFYQAYGDDELVRIYAQATDMEAKAIINALASAAPAMARLQGSDLDVRSIVANAAKAIINAKRKGVSLSTFAKQLDMTINRHEHWMIGYFAASVRAPRHIAEMLNALAKNAYEESNKPAFDMFGAAPKKSVEQLLQDQGYEPSTKQGNGQRVGREPVAGAGGVEADEQDGQNQAQGDQGVAQPTQDYGDEFSLNTYDAKKLKQDDDAVKAAKAEAAKVEAELIKQEKARLEREDIARRSVAAAKTFELGQDATTNLSGQSGFNFFATGREYDPNQLTLLLDQQPLRPGEDTQQTRSDRAGLATNALVRGSRGSLLGLSIATDWIRGKGSDLIGKRVTSPADLATLGAVLRDPRAETFRYFLVKEGKIVYHTAISSRLVGSTSAIIGDADAFLVGIKATMERLGADGYYLMHNHPSRLVEASQADIYTTNTIANAIPGFLGHVILDHTEFGLIEAFAYEGRKELHAADTGAQPLNVTGQDPTRSNAIPHAKLDAVVNGPAALASMADAVRQPENVVLVAVDGQMHVTGIMQVSQESMRKGGLSAFKNLVRLRKAAGSNEVFAILPEGMKFGDLDKSFTKNGWLLDVHIAASRKGSAIEENLMAYQRGGVKGKERAAMSVDQPVNPYQTELLSRMEEAQREELAIAERKGSPQMDLFAEIYRETAEVKPAKAPPAKNAKQQSDEQLKDIAKRRLEDFNKSGGKDMAAKEDSSAAVEELAQRKKASYDEGMKNALSIDDALESIKQSDIPPAEQIKLAADLRKGNVSPEDVQVVLGTTNETASSSTSEAESKASIIKEREDRAVKFGRDKIQEETRAALAGMVLGRDIGESFEGYLARKPSLKIKHDAYKAWLDGVTPGREAAAPQAKDNPDGWTENEAKENAQITSDILEWAIKDISLYPSIEKASGGSVYFEVYLNEDDAGFVGKEIAKIRIGDHRGIRSQDVGIRLDVGDVFAQIDSAIEFVQSKVAQIKQTQTPKAEQPASAEEYRIQHRPMNDAGGAARLDDLTTAFGEDVYGENALQYFGSGDAREKNTVRILQSLRGKPDATVTIYRGTVKGGEIKSGDWVTLDKSVAQDYADGILEDEGKQSEVVSMEVPASHITAWADSLLEFGYLPKGDRFSQSAPSTEGLSGSEFWRKIRAGESFTEKELEDAYSIGRRGTTRAGQRLRPQMFSGTHEAARESFVWADKIAGFNGYQTFSKRITPDRFYVGVAPEELDAQYPDGIDILGYTFTKLDNGKYRLDVDDPIPGTPAFDELEKRGRIEETKNIGSNDAPYYRVKLDDRYTTSRTLIQEAVRRLAIEIGEVPTIVQMGRETGARADNSLPREFSADMIESKFSQSAPTYTPITRERATTKIESILGKKLTKVLLDSGIIKLVGSDKEFGAVGQLFSSSESYEVETPIGTAYTDLLGFPVVSFSLSGYLDESKPSGEKWFVSSTAKSPAATSRPSESGAFETYSDARDYMRSIGVNAPDTVRTPTGYSPVDINLEHLAGVWLENSEKEKSDKKWRNAKNVYLRYGKIPESGKSKNYTDNIDELGVSVFLGQILENGEARIITNHNFQVGTLLVGGIRNRPLYIIEGDEVGTGSDGEPVLVNAKAFPVKQYAKKLFANDKFSQSNLVKKGVTHDNGNIELALNNITEDEFDGILTHEFLHSALENFLGKDTYAQLEKRMEVLDKLAGKTIKEGGELKTWFEQARAAMPANTPEAHRTEELMGYGVEGYINGAKQPNAIVRLVESLLSALRQAIIKHMPKGKIKEWAMLNLKPQDLAGLAVSGMKAKARDVATGRTQDTEIRGMVEQYASRTDTPSEGEVQKAIRQYKDVEATRGTEGWMKAPNGKPTNLNERNWILTQTPNFKRFYGNGPVDENGDAVVLFHGTPDGGFDTFHPESYFAESGKLASIYTSTSASSIAASTKRGAAPTVYPVFVGMKKPFDTRIPEVRKIFEREFYNKYGTGTNLQTSGLPDWNDARDLADWIHEEGKGFDGLIVDEGGLPQEDGGVLSRGVSYIPLESNQVKSAISNLGTFSERGNIMYSQAEIKHFYSQLRKAVSEAPDRVFGTGNATALWLQANAGKLGIKKEEMHWTGILDYLSLRGKEKAGKADVLTFLEGNGVSVEEVTLGEGTSQKNKDRIKELWAIQRPLRTEAQQAELDMLESDHMRLQNEQTTTKFSGYAPPGGIPGSYRELLLTLPSKMPDGWKIVERDGKFALLNKRDEQITARPTRKSIEEIARKYANDPTMGGSNFRSSHFDQPNILAHLRVDEVAGANGERLLRVIEVQSDWGQKGRKEGFAGEKTAPKISVQNNEDAPGYVVLRDGTAIWTGLSETRANEVAERERTKLNEGIPPAPFVTETQAYVALALKKAISYAAQNGMDGIVFATGQQNADLYDLSKQVDAVRVTFSDSGARTVGVETAGNRNHILMDVSEGGTVTFADSQPELHGKALADVIGKEMADKVMASVTDREFSGFDLKVGGEGMLKFYDEIIPQVASKVLRQIGAETKVGNINVAAVPRETKTGWESTGSAVDMPVAVQSGFLLSKDLRAKVRNEGLPLFSQRQGTSDIASLNKKIQEEEGIANAFTASTFNDKGLTNAYKSAFGVEIVYVSPASTRSEQFLGIHYKGKLYVNPENQHHGFMQLAGHELLHALKRDNPAIYKYLTDKTRDAIVSGGLQKYKERLGDGAFADSFAEEELYGDAVGDALADPRFLQALAESDPKKFVSLMNSIKAWLRKVLTKMKLQGFGSSEYFSDISNLHDHIGAALAAYAERQNLSDVGNIDELKYSRNKQLIPSTPPAQPPRQSKTTTIRDEVDAGRPLGEILNLLNRNQIVQLYGKDMPELHDYKNAQEQITADRNALQEESDDLLNVLRKLPKSVRDQFAGIAHEATIEGFDPSIDYAESEKIKELTRLIKGLEQRKRESGLTEKQEKLLATSKRHLEAKPDKHRKLRERFNLIPKSARDAFTALRDKYQTTAKMVFDELEARIERMDVDEDVKRSVIADLRVEYDRVKNTVYFPLARFGDFVVIGTRVADGIGDKAVEYYDSENQAIAAAERMRKDGYAVKRTMRKAYSESLAKEQAISDIVGKIKGMRDTKQADAFAFEQFDALLDDINQAIIQMQPDASYRRHFMHRKNVPGYSTDFIRAYADSMWHAANHIANLRHSDDITKSIQQMQERIDTSDGDVTALQDVVNHIIKREEKLREATSPFAAMVGQAGFLAALASTSNFFVNLTQTPVLTMPWLGGDYGYFKASKQLARAAKSQYDAIGKVKSLRELGKALDMRTTLKGVELEIFNRLHHAGKIDITQAHDLIAAANMETPANPDSPWNSLMLVGALPQHISEVFNRQISSLAALRLEMARSGDKDKAFQAAVDALEETHFDYEKSNRALALHGNWQRIAFMFKQYAQNAAFLWGRTAWLAMKGQGIEKSVARKRLAGMVGMQFAMSGLLGLPIFLEAGIIASGVAGFRVAGKKGAYTAVGLAVLAAIAAGIGDDDEDDFDTEVRAWLAEHVGQEWGEVLARGAVRLTGIDIASRVNADEFLIRKPDPTLEGRDYYTKWLESLGGFVFGYGANIAQGVSLMSDGKVYRGMEKMIPVKQVRDAMTAARFQMEGATNLSGHNLLKGSDHEEPTNWEVITKMAGFQPARIAEVYEGNASVKNAERILNAGRQDLLDRRWEAWSRKDRDSVKKIDDKIKMFNEKHPTHKITGDTKIRSIESHKQAEKQSSYGVRLSKKHDELQDKAGYANR